MLKNYLFSPLCSAPFLCSSPLFLFLSALHTSVFSFLFPGQPPLFLLFFSSSLLFLVFRCVALYFSAQNTFFFQPKRFSAFQPKHYCFSPKLSSVQPKTFFFFFSSVTLLFFYFSVDMLLF